MRTDSYDKLVRDHIPEMARGRGAVPHVRTADDGEYLERLMAKLREECEEFIESRSAEELADVQEVIHALTNAIGTTMAEVETQRQRKKRERGGFEGKIILVSVDEQED